MQIDPIRSWKIDFEPEIRWSELYHLLATIEAYRLSAQKIPLPEWKRNKLDKINIIRTIRGTTGLEGNTFTEAEVDAVLSSLEDENYERSREEQEVINARDVLEFIKRDAPKAGKADITENLIRHIHELTTKDIAYKDNMPGHYRAHETRAGAYLPPEHHEIADLMHRFVKLINSAYFMRESSPVVRAILAHFYLVTIHPFGDGNGRTSRGLEAYILYDGGYNVVGFYSLANFYYRNRDQYIQQLQDARFKHDGDLTEFIKFSLRGFAEELSRVQDEILAFVKEVMYKDLVQELFEKKIINNRQYVLIRSLLRTKNVKDATISARDLMSPIHPLSALWKDSSKAALYKDLRQLKHMSLLTQDKKTFCINLGIMDLYI